MEQKMKREKSTVIKSSLVRSIVNSKEIQYNAWENTRKALCGKKEAGLGFYSFTIVHLSGCVFVCAFFPSQEGMVNNTRENIFKVAALALCLL